MNKTCNVPDIVLGIEEVLDKSNKLTNNQILYK